MKKVLITTLAIAFLFSFSSVNAQLQAPIDGITITSDPESPAPGQSVTVSIESYLIDLNSSSIVWLSNGTNIAHGVGIKTTTVKAPVAGKQLVVTAVIKANTGREIQKTVTIKSGSVDILWETEGYAPPFFKGKNPLIFQNKVKLIAMPHLSLDGIKEVDPKSLIYQWKNGGKYIDGGLGYGDQSVTIQTDTVPKPLEIQVDIYTRDQSQKASKTITIQPVEPTVSFYEQDPLYGILFNKALGNRVSLENSEMTVFASPFGFDFKNNALNYTWSINNVERPDLSKNQSITLKTKGDADGTSNISLQIRNIKSILQGVQSEFNISFKKKAVDDSSVTF